MLTGRRLFLAAALLPVAARAQPSAELAAKAARRFPQPVRVGDLIDRRVLEPTPAQRVLGRVAAIRRGPGGHVEMIVRHGGLLGFGTRRIAVPIEAVGLLGEFVAILDFTPDQLAAFPALTEGGPAPLGADEIIRVGLTKPFH